MSENNDVICFQCGLAIADPPVIRELPGGGSCSACAARVLASLPPLLPSEVAEEIEQQHSDVPSSSIGGTYESSDDPPEPA